MADSSSWIDTCAAFGSHHDVPSWVLDDLEAFVTGHPRGGPPPPAEKAWTGTFDDLEQSFGDPVDVDAVAARLAAEAEGGQPAMFARRARAVEGILRGIGSPAARVLRVALRVRLEGICAAPPPRLRRVRALADFYFSLAARLKHPEWVESDAHLESLIAALEWSSAGDGIEHAALDGYADGMPVHVNLLRVDPKSVAIRVENLSPITSKGVAFEKAVHGRAKAAVSGGFFLYSEDDIELPSRRHDPVGLLLIDGVMHSAPVFDRASLLVGAGGDTELRIVGLSDVELRVEGKPLRILESWNRARAAVGPAVPSVAIVGDEVCAVGESLPVPLNGFVATVEGAGAARLTPGSRLTCSCPLLGDGSPAVAGIAGGPMIVEEGRWLLDMRREDFWGTAPPITFSQDETGDRNLLARMGAGQDGEGRLVVAAVDGRNVERALGMTLHDVARLMILLGCHTAFNLDGGSSKRMVVTDRIVDLPSTEIVAGESDVVRVRPVHSAVLFQPK